MQQKPPFRRLIRFVDSAGGVQYGDLAPEIKTDKIEGSTVDIVSGSINDGFVNTGQQTTVEKVRDVHS